MTKPLDEILAALPPARRAQIEARSQEIMAEYMTLQDLRKALFLTQQQMAELLNIRQDSISKLEKRSDLLISTLRNYVEKMGGELKLVAEFPGRPPVILEGLADFSDLEQPTLKDQPSS
jgi:DNA-binding XRE family transcriptional regulator